MWSALGQQLVYWSGSFFTVSMRIDPMHKGANSNQDNNYNKCYHIIDSKDLHHPAEMIKEPVPLGPTGHLPHKATLPKLRDIADLPNK